MTPQINFQELKRASLVKKSLFGSDQPVEQPIIEKEMSEDSDTDDDDVDIL